MQAGMILPFRELYKKGFKYNYNFEKQTETDEMGEREYYTFDSVQVAKNHNYGDVVDAIIRSKYSQSEELALINNVSVSEPKLEHLNEYTDFQAFREEAKKIAKVTMLKTFADWNVLTLETIDDYAKNIIQIIERTTGYNNLNKTDKINLILSVMDG